MKKILFIAFLALLLAAPTAQAAGTVSIDSDQIHSQGTDTIRVVTISYTADAAAATVPDTKIWGGATGMHHGTLAGWSFRRLETYGKHGGTKPTADTDVYLHQAGGGITTVADMVDVLGGNGVDELDAATNNAVTLTTPWPVIDALYTRVANNAVNSATWKFRLVFILK